MAALKTPWYDKAVEALKLNGKSERTQQAYARHVRKLIEFYNGKNPDRITEDELKNYFIHRQDVDKWQPNTCGSVTVPSNYSISMSYNATGTC